MQTSSISGSQVAPVRRHVDLAQRRYTVNLTHRQEEAIIAECDRRGLGIAELFRRIIDGWIESRLSKRTSEGGQ